MKGCRRPCPLLLLASLLFAAALCGAAPVSTAVFPRITAEDRAVLERGEVIIRAVSGADRLSLSPFDSRAATLLADVAKLKPNYLTEFLMAIPLEGAQKGEAVLEGLARALADVAGYNKIPYWSVRQQTTYDLFDKMEILARRPSGKGEAIEVLQHMEPFDDFRAVYEYRSIAGGLEFSGVNLDSVIYTYRNFSAVSPGNLVWRLYAFEKEGRLYACGVGAVKAFDLFGIVRDRLEPSFMGRVEAFFRHISRQIRK